MIRSTLLAGIALRAVALATAIGIEEQRLTAVRSKAAVAALRTVNMTAARDSTRDVAQENGRIASLLGDSLRLVERQILQVAQPSDAIDEALGRERRARYTMNVAVDPLQSAVRVASVVDSAHGVRRANFDLRQPPYTVTAAVEIREQLDSAKLSVPPAALPQLAARRLSHKRS